MAKYNIGDLVYYVYASNHMEQTISCPICFGNKYCTLILGNDEKVESECGYCSSGFEGPRGYIKTYNPKAEVMSGVINGISMRDGIRYEVGYHSLRESELFTTKESAEPFRKIEEERVIEQAKKWSESNFVNCTKKQMWSAGYHRNQIKDAERKIEWHRSKISMIKESK